MDFALSAVLLTVTGLSCNKSDSVDITYQLLIVAFILRVTDLS